MPEKVREIPKKPNIHPCGLGGRYRYQQAVQTASTGMSLSHFFTRIVGFFIAHPNNWPCGGAFNSTGSAHPASSFCT
jgi:hypothetical protein